MSGTLALYFQQILKRLWVKYGSKFPSLPDLILSSTFLYFAQGQPIITAENFFFLIINPTNIMNLLQAAYSAGTLFVFSFYLDFHYYSTTIIKDGFPSANANLVILLVHY